MCQRSFNGITVLKFSSNASKTFPLCKRFKQIYNIFEQSKISSSGIPRLKLPRSEYLTVIP
jgi:hypothetical protein